MCINGDRGTCESSDLIKGRLDESSTESIEHLDTYLKIATERKDTAGQAIACEALATALSDRGDLEKAEGYLQQYRQVQTIGPDM